jgi:hypothetical protein
MSYDSIGSLNDLDVAEPLDGASPAELLEAFRQLKTLVKNTLLVSHHPDGRLRSGSVSNLDADSVGSLQIAAKAVTIGKIDDLAVTTATIADGAVTAVKLANGSVTEDKYGTASIPAAAYKPNTIPLTALGGFITRNYLSSHANNDALRAVTELAIADNAVVDRAVKNVGVGKLTGGSDLSALIKLSGVWTAVALSGGLTYDPDTSSFVVQSGVKVAIVADAKSRGTDGGGAVSGSWNIRTLGELVDEENLLTFSANKFKLLPGTYFFYLECPAYNVGLHQARLFDVTNNEAVLWGSSASSTAASGITTKSVLVGAVTNTDADTEYQIEHWVATAVGSSDLGKASSSDNTLPSGPAPFANHREIYTQGFVVKIA